jgi:hypothetical protein
MSIRDNDGDERRYSGCGWIGGIDNCAIVGSSEGWIISNATGSDWTGSHVIRVSLLTAMSAAAQ